MTVAELRFGVANLPAGKRRDELQTSLENQILPLFAGRVCPFDMACATAYADLMAKAKSAGLAIAAADGYSISAITDLASRHEMSVHSKPQVSTLSTLGIRMTQEALS